MTFRRKMQHRIGIEITDCSFDRITVCNISLKEVMARRGHDCREGFPMPGIGKFIDCEHFMPGVDGSAHCRRADEPSAAGHDQSHPYSPPAELPDNAR